MIFLNEHKKKINELYNQLQDLKEGRKVLERAMHHNFYNKTIYNKLFEKLTLQNEKIKQIQKEITKEKEDYEKSR